MDVSLFDFDLPEKHVALRPACPRDSARMLVVYSDGRLEHRTVKDLPEYLRVGDAMVVNDTRVIAARLQGLRLRAGSPARVEILLHRRLSPNRFSVLAKPARKLAVGDPLMFGDLWARVAEKPSAGNVEIEFALSGTELDAAIAVRGQVPLPPYIGGRRKPDGRDLTDYQTLFASNEGSVAVPTAGLHFTPDLLTRIAKVGATCEAITLHVGLGTFLPVKTKDTVHHRMHSEWAMLRTATARRLNRVRAQGGRIIAIGTTSLRTLESAASPDGQLHAFEGETDIFITPGYRFRVPDILLTNFHLPRSTLFMLVSAFMGVDVIKKTYAEAISTGYRFYSYGDACLLLRV